MKKYIVIYHAPMSAVEQMKDATPEDMEPWMAWAKRCGDGLVDMGTPLGGQKITNSGTSPSGKNVIGYSILQSANMEAALALLKGHPHLEWAAGCEIEVHESLQVPA